MAQPFNASTSVVATETTDVEFGVNLKSYEDARKAISEAQQEENEEFVYVSKLHTDVVQLLAIGLLSYAQVWDNAVELAKQQDDYSIGRVFDIYNGDNDKYGAHVFSVIGQLNPQSEVNSLVYTKDKSIERPQLIINSELLEDKYSGKRFYKVLLRGQNVSTDKFGPFRSTKKRFNTQTAVRLYVLQGADGKTAFRLNGEAINLGAPEIYTKIAAGIKASGAVAIYEKAMNSLGDDLINHLTEERDDNQALFMTVFGKCVAELKENRKALREARAKQIADMANKSMDSSEASAPVNTNATV